MRIQRAFVSIIGAVLLTASMGTAALAQQTQPVPIDVAVGVAPDAGLTFVLSGVSEFQDVHYSFETQTTTGSIAASVTDSRGTRAGWNVTVKASDFVGRNTNDTIPISNLVLTPGAVLVVAGQATPVPVASAVTMSTTDQSLFRAAAGSGNGRYNVIVSGTLTIPGATVIDTYETTITATLNAAP